MRKELQEFKNAFSFAFSRVMAGCLRKIRRTPSAISGVHCDRSTKALPWRAFVVLALSDVRRQGNIENERSVIVPRRLLHLLSYLPLIRWERADDKAKGLERLRRLLPSS